MLLGIVAFYGSIDRIYCNILHHIDATTDEPVPTLLIRYGLVGVTVSYMGSCNSWYHHTRNNGTVEDPLRDGCPTTAHMIITLRFCPVGFQLGKVSMSILQLISETKFKPLSSSEAPHQLKLNTYNA